MTNARDQPCVGREIAAEIESADRIDVVMAFIRWTEVAAARVADITDPDRAQDALNELDRRCDAFDNLPQRLKQEALGIATTPARKGLQVLDCTGDSWKH